MTAMDYNMLEDAEFRRVARAFIETSYPDIPRFVQRRLHWLENKPWYMALSRAGWLAPAWPRQHGGMGLSAIKQLILIEEFERFGCARISDVGTVMLGPLLIKFGTAEQMSLFLPKILSGEHIWAQGYSEPNAGSDLAALRTGAVLDGGDWVINGQKTWTTLGNDANWMFILARTDKSAKKQAGISFLLVPMDAPGITVRPILNLDLHDEFSEVFFDAVRIPASNLVGEINGGWTMAKALLGDERVFIGAPRLSTDALARLQRIAQHAGSWDDPAFRDRYIRLRLDLEDFSALFATYVERLRAGQPIGPDVAMLKLFQSELFQAISDIILEVAGEGAGLIGPLDNDPQMQAAATFFLARPTTIFGGSSEIMRNLLARSVLELPA